MATRTRAAVAAVVSLVAAVVRAVAAVARAAVVAVAAAKVQGAPAHPSLEEVEAGRQQIDILVGRIVATFLNERSRDA